MVHSGYDPRCPRACAALAIFAFLVCLSPSTWASASPQDTAGEIRPVVHSEDDGPKWTDIVIAAAALGSMVFSAALWISTHRLWKETRRLALGSETQSAEMNRSINEAARSASAMEDVAASMAANVKTTTQMAADQREFWARQMRAYITVTIAGAVYQETAKGLKFEGKPNVANVGLTPAYKFRHRIRAKVLPVPLPEEFQFGLPVEPNLSSNALGPRQEIVISALLDETFPDDEVARIKSAQGRALYVWGCINYEDLFSKQHFTNFCHLMTWVQGDQVWGFYLSSHNDSD